MRGSECGVIGAHDLQGLAEMTFFGVYRKMAVKRLNIN